jgi:hypothetical protein
MTAVTLSREFETWAEAEVQAGAADTVEAFTQRVLERHRAGVEKLRASLDEAEAEAERDGWIPADLVFAELAALLADDE